MSAYPEVLNLDKVGSYPALACGGGGYVWDEVLEYRVWCHPERGAEDLENGDDYYYVFPDYESALQFHQSENGAASPLALILQREHINEPNIGEYMHVTEERITEWPADFLSRPRRTARTIPDFLAPDAPANRLDILRGNA